MNVAAGPRLAAAVTNAGVLIWLLAPSWMCNSDIPCHTVLAHWPLAGGIGVIGGMMNTPKMLRQSIDDLTSQLEDKDAPFGVDLPILQVGGGARKTNVKIQNLPVTCNIHLFWSISTTMPKASCRSSRTSSSKRRPPFSSVRSESPPKTWSTSSTLLGLL